MMVFRARGALTFKLRVTGTGGEEATLSTGRVVKADAELVETQVRRWRGREGQQYARPDVITLLVRKKLTLARAYDASLDGTLDRIVRELVGAESDPDLDPKVKAWADAGANAKYVAQVRALIPAGVRFPLSQFTRKRALAFLRGLDVSVSTRRHYKAALSAFANLLVDDELLDVNPTWRLPLGRVKRTRTLNFLTAAQSKTLVESITDREQRALEALMAGSGIEWQAIARLYARDVDVEHRMVFAQGTKTEYRTRWIEVTEDWAWEIVRTYVRTMTPASKLFTLREEMALARHHARAAALELPRTTLHQYRHSFAVLWIQRGACGGLRADQRDEQWLKNQLGHAPESNQLRATYGVYIGAAKLTAQQEARQPKAKGAK